MALPIEGKLAHDGNSRVVALAEGMLAEAKGGDAQYGVWILCKADERGQPSPYFISECTGGAGYEMIVYYALAHLQQLIQSGAMKRELPPSFSTVRRDASYVVMNMAKGAWSFDFTAWLVDAWMTMLKEGAPPPLKVCFCHPDKPGQDLENAADIMMFNNVVRPMLRLIGAVEVNEVCDRMKQHALYYDVSNMARQGVPVPKFSASGKHLQTMRGYAGCVTITLRETLYWEHRNSNTVEWLKFAHWLKARGERVVFVRDTKYATQPVDDWETCSSAAVDLEQRMALYQQAKCNCFVSNGPWNLALFSDIPWMMFVTVETSKEFDERDTFPSSREGWWEKYHGVKEGAQFPWSNSQQKIVWEHDTYERMKETWLEFFGNAKPAAIPSASSTQRGGKTKKAATVR